MHSFQPKRFGKYLLLDKVAVGGMAELYRAKITGLQGFEKLIAIKRILPHLAAEDELVKAFIEEAKLAALLQHLNIIQIYDFGSMNGAYFIAMEYLYGKDLQKVVNNSRSKKLPISLENALYLISQICDGLDYAHSLKDLQGNPLNIIHRDISPQNVFITYDGQVKIIDFGIAKAAIQNTKTQAGVIKGKASYMSPEQAEGTIVDYRSDIFSVGILLFELVMHRRLFEGDMFRVLSQLREFELELPANIRNEIPTTLYEILRKALAKDPEKRYQSGGQMRSDLEDYIYQLSYRPSTRNVALYMKELFEDEIAAEKLVMVEAAQIGSVKESDPGLENPIKEEKYEKTMILAPAEQADANATPPSADDEDEDIESEQRTRRHKKRFYYTAFIAALILIGVFFASFFKEGPDSYELKSGLPALKAERSSDVADLLREVLANGHSSKSKTSGAHEEALQNMDSEIVTTNPDKAEALLLKAVELDPEYENAYFRLGLLYMKKKDYPKSIDNFEKAVALDPRFAKAFFNLGYIYMITRDYGHAKEMYGRVVELSPPFVDEAFFNLAIIHKKLGERDACIEKLKQAIAANPRNEMAKQYLRRFNS